MCCVLPSLDHTTHRISTTMNVYTQYFPISLWAVKQGSLEQQDVQPLFDRDHSVYQFLSHVLLLCFVFSKIQFLLFASVSVYFLCWLAQLLHTTDVTSLCHDRSDMMMSHLSADESEYLSSRHALLILCISKALVTVLHLHLQPSYLSFQGRHSGPQQLSLLYSSHITLFSCVH